MSSTDQEQDSPNKSPLVVLATGLRLAEFVFAALVVGINAAILHRVSNSFSAASEMHEYKCILGFAIYTEVVAVLALILAFVWLLPSTAHLKPGLADPVFFILWIVAFGFVLSVSAPLLSLSRTPCKSARGKLTPTGPQSSRGGLFETIPAVKEVCGWGKAVAAFCFISGICWFASGILYIWFSDPQNNVFRRATTGTSHV